MRFEEEAAEPLDLQQVRELARSAHAGQTDKLGRDYFEAHLAPIAARLRPEGPWPEMAGWLHDIVEDQGWTQQGLLAAGVPTQVVDAVLAVTKRPGEPYDDLIRRSAAHPIGRVVKLADNAHNLASNAELAAVDPSAAAELREKYERARELLLDADLTHALADQLGWDPPTFARTFGAGWKVARDVPVWHDYDADPSGNEGLPSGPWHITGEPPQLMLRISPFGGIFLARPEGYWEHGTHGLAYRPTDETFVAGVALEDEAPPVVRRLLRARRRSFRYCRYCLDRVPPERRLGDDVCMGCASAWEGVVY